MPYQTKTACWWITAIVLFNLSIISCTKVSNKPAGGGNTPPGTTDTTSSADTTRPYDIDLTTKVISSVSGFVRSSNMGPIVPEGVLVTYGNKTTLTDKYGYFEIKNALVVKQAAQLTISRQDFITNYRTFIAEEGKSFFIKMNMDHVPGGIFQAASGYQFEDGLGTYVTIPAGALVNEATNTLYSGFARPYLKKIEMGDEDMSIKMPGNVMGLDSLGYPKFLTSIGVVTLVVQGENGEKLQLAEGASISVSFRYYGDGLPATVAAWHYDTNTGLWRKEGTATKVEYAYTYEMKKLGSYNFAIATGCIQFKGRLLTASGEPLPFTYVNANPLSQAEFFYPKPAWLYTDENGFVSGLAPAGSAFSLDVHGDQCNIPVYSKVFNASTADISFGDIRIESSKIVSVNAKVTGCDGAGITNGYLMVYSPHNYFHLDASNNGAVHFNAVVCDFDQLQRYMFIAEDRNTMQISDNLYAAMVPGNNDLGNLSTCGLNGIVRVSFRLLDNAGNPLEGLYIKMIPSWAPAGAFQEESVSTGLVSTSVYTNTDFVLSVYGARDCNSPLFTKSFSTTNRDTSLGNFTITGITKANIIGTVVDCNNNPVTSGYVTMRRYNKDHQYALNSSGNFNIDMRLCDAASSESIILIGQDAAKLQTSYPVNVNILPGANNAGYIKACFDPLSDLQFINYTIDDTIYRSYSSPPGTLSQSLDPTGNWMYISGSNTDNGLVAGFVISTYSIAAGSTQGLDEFTSPEGPWSIIPPLSTNITEYGPVGGYIAGNFTGQVQSSERPAPAKVTCSFRVKRNH